MLYFQLTRRSGAGSILEEEGCCEEGQVECKKYEDDRTHHVGIIGPGSPQESKAMADITSGTIHCTL